MTNKEQQFKDFNKEINNDEIIEDNYHLNNQLIDNNQEEYEEVTNNFQGNIDDNKNSESIYEENINAETTNYYHSNKNKHYLKIFLATLTAFSLGGLSVFAVQGYYESNKIINGSRVTLTKEDKENQEITINAVSKAKDAVVSVVNYQSNSTSNTFSIFNNKNNSGLKVASNGSGVIYKKEGNFAYIITNEHVITNAEKLNVVLSDGTVVDAELIGQDIWTDLAVLKINSEQVNVVMDIADSDKVAVGQTALAIGSPLGLSLSNSVTKGIVSAIERQIPIDIDKDGVYDWYQTVMQTDAAINPGNSGGALINSSGELIGINELKITNASQSTTAEGIGFVIPSNEVKIIVEQLEKTGKVTRPALGVQLVSVSSLNKDLLRETLNYNGNKGVVIKSVEFASAAEKAGLKDYDIITKLNDSDIDGVADLRKYLFEKTKIGDKIKLTYYREGKEYTTDLTLGKLSN